MRGRTERPDFVFVPSAGLSHVISTDNSALDPSDSSFWTGGNVPSLSYTRWMGLTDLGTEESWWT